MSFAGPAREIKGGLNRDRGAPLPVPARSCPEIATVARSPRRFCPDVIVLGMSATGLSTLRLLGREGVRCWGVDTRPDLLAFASRYCERGIHIRDRSTEELARVLRDVAATCAGRPVVLPTSDRFVRLLSELYDPVRGPFDAALPPRDVVADLLDKQRFAALAARVGLRVPRSAAVTSGVSLEAAVREVGYPAIVKPRSPERLRTAFPKAALVETDGDLSALRARCPDPGAAELIAQQYVPGNDLCHVSVAAALDAASRPLATFVARKRRQANHGAGVGTFVESYRDDEATSMTLGLLQRIGYIGVAEMELKRHSGTNELFAIEVNPRVWTQIMLPAVAGVNFAMLYHRIATGAAGVCEPVAAAPAAGWQDMWADFYWTFCRGGYWRRGEVSMSTWLRQTLTCRTGATFFWRDPLPALRRLGQGLSSGAEKG